jgi:hypothetical protein
MIPYQALLRATLPGLAGVLLSLVALLMYWVWS